MQCLTQFGPYYEPSLCPHTIYPLIMHNNALHTLDLECAPPHLHHNFYLPFHNWLRQLVAYIPGDPAIVKIGNISLLVCFPSQPLCRLCEGWDHI